MSLLDSIHTTFSSLQLVSPSNYSYHGVRLLNHSDYVQIAHQTVSSAQPAYVYMIAFTALLAFVLSLYLQGNPVNAKFSAPRSGWSLTVFARFQFALNADKVIWDGYRKVSRLKGESGASVDGSSQFKDQIFKLSGSDMLIVPAKFADEMRNMPEHLLDAIKANTDNFQGVYSATSILNHSNLHNFVLQTKLTPKLSALVPIVCEELDYAMEKEFPKCEGEWKSEPGFPLLIALISRLASRLFVGPELCRNDKWLATSRGYTENAFKTIIFLRCFPNWLKPIISCFDPFAWQVVYHLSSARRLLIPLIWQRREAKEAGVSEEGLKFTNLLQLMDDEAGPEDKDPDYLTRRTLVLTLASSHTTSMAACQALFELCNRPEYIPILREEVETVLREGNGWHKTTLTKLKKLDSFMKESQRWHPPSTLGFKRNILQPITLSDGTVLPPGAHMLMPIVPHQTEDPRLVNPEQFDGLRYWRLRQEPGNEHKMQFATTDKHTLHFGHGRHACPGRFLASNTIKILLGTLLLEYDFRFPEGQGRPKDVHAHEYIFPNPWGKVEFRRRGT